MVDASLRFDSGIDAGDASHIFAITDRSTNRRGLLIEAFDVFDELHKRGSARRLEACLAEPAIGASDVPSRNGLRKIYKIEFDDDTERFVLRIGYPDFPKRRSGRTATMLGFDTAEQSYVWLVPSVVRDARLARVPYHGEFATDDE